MKSRYSNTREGILMADSDYKVGSIMERQIEVDGGALHFRVRGEGDPVVLVQGVGLHGDGWSPQVDALSSRYQCITFDNRGMGRSQPVPRGLTVDRMVSDTLAVMDAAGARAAHLVGHSLGGCVALGVALREPTRVRSLALLCTSARGADATKLTLPMLLLGLRTRIGSRKMRRAAFLEIVLSPDYRKSHDLAVAAARLAPLFGHDLADSPPVAMKQLSALGNFDVTHQLRELSGQPTLVICGGNDLIFPPRCARMLADGIPGAELIEYPHAAHGLPIEMADEVNRKILEHLASTS
jgi:pimeloyl-ACP methyl ester carboxylesterase